MEKKKTLVYIASEIPDDKRSWSGITYNLARQLGRYYDVEAIWLQDSKLVKAFCLAYKTLWRLTGKRNNPCSTTFYAKLKGRRITRLLKDKKADAVFFLGCDLAAYARTDIPRRAYFSDTTFHLMVDYYFFHLTDGNVRSGNELQRRAMENCNVNVFASNWALRDAVDFYHIQESTCHLGYFGASVDTTEFRRQKHDANLVNLLFVGCNPPYEVKDENIKFYGFLNRNIPEQARTMIHLREQADIFLLPTRAECAGIVFCESSAYGIPSITFDTGGIGDYVINGENGYRLPMGSTSEDFADKILDVFADNGKLQYMQEKAVEMYRERMNWDALGDKLKEYIG